MKSKPIILFLLFSVINSAYASINVDRTRIIFSEEKDSISMTLSNNAEQPYLAQAWIENEKGEKVSDNFVVIPPIQRIEANEKNQIKIVKSESNKSLSDNKETLFYLKIKEIPPKSEHENNVQIALQSKLKLFYRPDAIKTKEDQSWLKEVKISYTNKIIKIDNLSDYYVNIADVMDVDNNVIKDIGYNMLKPKYTKEIKLSNGISSEIKIGYIDDYGAIRLLTYTLNGQQFILQNKE